jgi:hypothetical protein
MRALKVVDSLKHEDVGQRVTKIRCTFGKVLVFLPHGLRRPHGEKYATDEIKKQIESGELTLNKAYQLFGKQ